MSTAHLEIPSPGTSLYDLHVTDMRIQHRRLAALVETLRTVVQQGSLSQTERSVQLLTDYLRLHFSDEEQFMQRYSYPKLHEHRRIHEDMLNQWLHVDLHRITPGYCEYILCWLGRHADEVDREYLQFFSSGQITH